MEHVERSMSSFSCQLKLGCRLVLASRGRHLLMLCARQLLCLSRLPSTNEPQMRTRVWLHGRQLPWPHSTWIEAVRRKMELLPYVYNR